MDWLTRILANLFETFKMKNPKVAAFIIIVAATVIKFAEQGTALGVFTLPVWASEALKWVALFILAVTGSQTFQYLTPNQKQVR